MKAKQISESANHYVMNANSQMLHRATLSGCREWVQEQTAQWKSYGMKPPVYRIFYDSGTEPAEIHNA